MEVKDGMICVSRWSPSPCALVATKGANPNLCEELVGAMLKHLGRKGVDIRELDMVAAPGQPFRLRLMAAMLKDAEDSDWEFLLRGEKGYPVRIKELLPRTPQVFEPQKWKLEMGPPQNLNYESAGDNLDFVRDHFKKYGKDGAISAIAVMVEEGPSGKRRIVHDASQTSC